jgi:predicted nucleic acid-binding protein
MASKICDISGYSLSSNDLLLFDANIWVYIWSPPHSPSDALSSAIGEYLRIYTEMVNQGIKILTSWLVLSEFANSLTRKSFQKHLELNPKSFKNNESKLYRDSKHFLPERKAIASYMKKILAKSKIISHNPDSMCYNNILKWYESKTDFNDAIYVEDSIASSYKIITHDEDFKRVWGEVEPIILTANQRMLIP